MPTNKFIKLIFFKRDFLGYNLFIKKIIIIVVGLYTHSWYSKRRLIIKGTEIIKTLPDTKVLFISNHQTYFADVSAMIHVINASLKNRVNSIKNPSYLFRSKYNLYYVASKVTMKSKFLSRVLEYTGSVSIGRPWIEKDNTPKMSDFSNIITAINTGWVINFPQGTTNPKAEVRNGTSFLIKKVQPIVIPIVIKGFSDFFHRTRLKTLDKNATMSITFKPPLNIDTDLSIEEINKLIKEAIEINPN